MGEGNWNESDLWQREAEENGLEYILPQLDHGLKILLGLDGECARK